MQLSNYKRYLFYLIAISTVIRCLIAYTLELGGEEAYYWTFALYPKLSHLDQPPMIGWLIQLFTNNLSLNGEFFTRSVSIFIGSLNTWIVFVLGRRMKNEKAGLYAAILYTTSIYCSIITGAFVTPDAPQSLFILLSIYFFHEGFITKYEDNEETRTLSSTALIMAGVFVGFALLSKFSSALIWLGVFIYLVLFDRRFLKKPQLYISVIISLLILSPVIIWNIKYNFIGFRYIDKVALAFADSTVLENIKTEFIRQIIYNNPVNIVVVFVALFSFKRAKYLKNSQYKLLLSLSVSFLLFGLISLGFFPLIMLTGAYLESKYHHRTRMKLPKALKNSIYAASVIVLVGLAQLYGGILNFETKKSPETKIGTNDVTIDRFGWRKLSKEFKKLRDLDVALGNISEHAYIISNNYLSAAHYDYYLANPNKIFVKTIGKIIETRKYAFTTQESGGFKIGENAYYIESSRDSISGIIIGHSYFDRVEIAETIYIHRLKKPVVRYTIYRFKELNAIPPKELSSVPVIYK